MTMSMQAAAQRIVLGTAQFGLPYGISHHGGAVPRQEAADILSLARDAGIATLDTAAAYGDSEILLGDLGEISGRFAVVTKTVPIRKGEIGDAELAAIDAGFMCSLSRLGRTTVAALLVHDAGDLLGRGGDRLWARLEQHRAAGRAERIGLSVYGAEEIDAAIARYPLEMIQLPLSVFDQRLLEDGTLERLAARGIAVHARSLFLQGLLLMNIETVPRTLREAVPLLRRWQETCAESGVTPLAAALAFGLSQPIDGLVIGVHSTEHLTACLAAAGGDVSLPWASFRCQEPAVIDPRRWRQ